MTKLSRLGFVLLVPLVIGVGVLAWTSRSLSSPATPQHTGSLDCRPVNAPINERGFRLVTKRLTESLAAEDQSCVENFVTSRFVEQQERLAGSQDWLGYAFDQGDAFPHLSYLAMASADVEFVGFRDGLPTDPVELAYGSFRAGEQYFRFTLMREDGSLRVDTLSRTLALQDGCCGVPAR